MTDFEEFDISSNDVVALRVGAGSGSIDSGSMGASSASVVVSFGRTFTGTPVVIAMLNSSNANDPLIPAMVTNVAAANDKCTVSFGDGLPSANYTLEIFASLAG